MLTDDPDALYNVEGELPLEFCVRHHSLSSPLAILPSLVPNPHFGCIADATQSVYAPVGFHLFKIKI